MTSQEYFAKSQAIADQVTEAVIQGDPAEVTRLTYEMSRLDKAWIAQSGYKAGQKVEFQGEEVTIDEVTDLVLHKGAIVCWVRTASGDREKVGLIPV